MKRDLELFRELLLEIESAEPVDRRNSPWITLGARGRKDDEIAYHARMLPEQGFLYEDRINLDGKHSSSGQRVVKFTADALSNRGHEFLDDVRDSVVWRKTKERSKGIASVGLGLIWEIAKAEIKMKVGLP